MDRIQRVSGSVDTLLILSNYLVPKVPQVPQEPQEPKETQEPQEPQKPKKPQEPQEPDGQSLSVLKDLY